MADRPVDSRRSGPLLVFGPRSLDYDFGPAHPLSPRRFGPGIELLRAVGAEPGLAPEPAPDEQLEWLHSPGYLAAVRRFSADPQGEKPEAGIGPGDDPPFAGMHDAAAAVAGGSIAAMTAILRGDVEHAYQPGGGLHHAMRDRASGFCVYNDVALAIARARRDGLRVMYVDLDVHHGDGVQALHYHDPGVLTVSFHETGRALFPGTGFVDELGEGSAAGTSVNVPLEPYCGPDAWLDAVKTVVPSLAAAFGPDVIVSQHGADGHALDPLAHLSLTTTAMGEAARLVDAVAHRRAGGRWFATGGGGYSVYRVVPRAWALTWLAGAHREVPRLLPAEWRERWAAHAGRWEHGELPLGFEDEVEGTVEPEAEGIDGGVGDGGPAGGGPAGGRTVRPDASAQAGRTVELVRTLTLPALLRAAEERGWWSPGADVRTQPEPAGGAATGRPEIVGLTAESLARLRLASRVVAPFDAAEGRALLEAALAGRAVAAGAVLGEWLIGVAIAAPLGVDAPIDDLLALGVAPHQRRGGVAEALLRALCDAQDRRGRGLVALHTAAERDPVDPLPREVRRSVAERLLDAAGFRPLRPPSGVSAADPDARLALRLPPADGPEATPEFLAALERRIERR